MKDKFLFILRLALAFSILAIFFSVTGYMVNLMWFLAGEENSEYLKTKAFCEPYSEKAQSEVPVKCLNYFGI